MEETIHPHAPVAPAEHRDRNIAAVSALLLLIGMPVGWLTDDPSTGDKIGMVGAIIVVLAIMAFLLLRLVPTERAAHPERAPRTALILGVVALLTCGVFWTGLPFAFGAAALALGLSVRDTGGGKATAAVVLGGFAVVASFVTLLIG